jgi:hypothetical protein
MRARIQLTVAIVLGAAVALGSAVVFACNTSPVITVDGKPFDWEGKYPDGGLAPDGGGITNYCLWQVNDPAGDETDGKTGDDVIGFAYTHDGAGTNPAYANVYLLIHLNGLPDTGVTYTIIHPGNAASGGATSKFTIKCTSTTACTTTVNVTGGTSANCNTSVNNINFPTTVAASGTGSYLEMSGGNFTQISANYAKCFDNTPYDLSVVLPDAGVADSVSLNGTSPDNFNGATAVTLLVFDAHPAAGGGVDLRWETGAEHGTLGFYLHRDAPDGPRVNALLIPGQLESPLGERYALSDPLGAPGQSYYLEEVATDGSHVYGPSSWVAGPAPHLGSKRPGPGPRARHHHGGHGNGEAFVRVTQGGLYALRAAGLQPFGLKPKQTVVSQDGVAQPLLVDGDVAYLLAPDPISVDRADDAYHLLSGSGRAPAQDSVLAPAGAPAPTFSDVVHIEQHHLADPASPDPAYRFPWGWAVSGWGPQTFTFDAPGFAGGPATLAVNLIGMVTFDQVPEHHVRASVNGTPLLDQTFAGLGEQSFAASLPAGVLLPSSNVLTLEAPGDLPVPYDMVGLSSVDVGYARGFHASNDALAFSAGPLQDVALDGFSSTPVLLDVTDPASPVLLKGATATSGANGAGLRFRTKRGSGTRRYLAAVPTDATLDASRASEVPSGSADWVAIYGEGLGDSLAPLVAERQAEGLSTLTVPVEALYDRFGSGEHGAAAIQRYLAQLSPAPRYVLLVGKPTYDPHDYLGTGAPDLVPSTVPANLALQTLAVTDAPLAAGPDGTPRFAIGRLPVSSASELDAWVQKLVAYETSRGPPTGLALFAADDVNPETGAADAFFQTESERLIAELGLTPERVYLPAQGGGDLLTALAAGPDVISYHGHANVVAWSTSGLLSAWGGLSVPSARPGLLISVDCWDGMFAWPGVTSLAQALAEAPNGGAIAAFSASTLVDELDDPFIDDGAYPALLDPSAARVGDVTRAAQAAYAVRPEVAMAYNLIGDPATHLPTR